MNDIAQTINQEKPLIKRGVIQRITDTINDIIIPDPIRDITILPKGGIATVDDIEYAYYSFRNNPFLLSETLNYLSLFHIAGKYIDSFWDIAVIPPLDPKKRDVVKFVYNTATLDDDKGRIMWTGRATKKLQRDLLERIDIKKIYNHKRD